LPEPKLVEAFDWVYAEQTTYLREQQAQYAAYVASFAVEERASFAVEETAAFAVEERASFAVEERTDEDAGATR
jgi:hypothetical protein